MAKLPKGLKGKTIEGSVQAVASEELEKQVTKEMHFTDADDSQSLDQIVADLKACESDCFCSEHSASEIFPPGSTKHNRNEDTRQHDETGSN